MPVPSPDKGGGFPGEASTLPGVKITYAHRNSGIASDRTDQTDDDTARTWTRRARRDKPLRIATWNVTSFNNKDQEIIMELNNNKIDICCLAETKKKGKGSSKYGDYILIYSGKDKNERAASGVGILINKQYERNISNVSYINDRLLQLTIKLQKTTTTHIISVYAPDINKPQAEIEDFYHNLQIILDCIPKQDELIIMGDLNARIGNDIIPGVKNRFNEETINGSGEILTQMCTQYELRINNTYFPHKPQHKFTFENTRGHKSIIDYIITNKNIHPTKIIDVRTLSSANAITNHGLVMAKIKCKTHREKQKLHQQSNKLNRESLADPSIRDLFQQRLKLKIAENKIEESDDIEMAWNKLRSNIISTAEEALGRRTTKGNGKPNNKPWFTQEVKELAAEKRKSYLQYRSRTITYDEYKLVRNRVNEGIQAIKRNYWEAFSSDMEHDLYGGQKKIWNMLRSRKKPVNEYIQTAKITTENWERYFEGLYEDLEGGTEAGNTSQTEEDTDTPPIWTISKEKIKQTITTIKNRKSPGIDEITNEMIKYGGDALVDELQTLYNKIISLKCIPLEWKTSITIPIFKKGDKADTQNYRGISLLSSVLKLLTKILSEEVSATGICEEQQGFRRNRSTIDAIFTIRQITEKAIEYNRPAYMCFVDLTQAFDRVKLKDVLTLLQKRNVHPNIVTIIKELNTNNNTFIKTENGITKKIPVAKGIRQGDSLSPMLFNVIMDEIIKEVKPIGRGYRMGNKEIKILCYADDVVLIAEHEDNLQRLLYKFEQTAEKFNMKISLKKTQSLTISKEPRRCKLAVYNQSVNQVMKFKYLGANITANRNLKEEAREQTTKATVISGYLRDIIWRNKNMSTESKVRIYKTCIRPIMSYAIETRAETTITKRLLRTTEMRTLRTIAGYTMYDRKRNEEIRDKCGIMDVVKWARVRRRNWRDHVSRMSDDRLTKISMKGKPHNSRPPGRPPRRWHESWTSASQD